MPRHLGAASQTAPQAKSSRSTNRKLRSTSAPLEMLRDKGKLDQDTAAPGVNYFFPHLVQMRTLKLEGKVAMKPIKLGSKSRL